jgi:hypothetical protein
VKYFGMTSLTNAATGAPLVPDLAKAMAAPNAMEIWPTLAHPLANKVGWFDLNNIAWRAVGNAAWLSRDLRGQSARQGAVEGNAAVC